MLEQMRSGESQPSSYLASSNTEGKLELNGAFKKMEYIEYIEYMEVKETSPWINYYLKNADKYPEITE